MQLAGAPPVGTTSAHLMGTIDMHNKQLVHQAGLIYRLQSERISQGAQLCNQSDRLDLRTLTGQVARNVHKLDDVHSNTDSQSFVHCKCCAEVS